MFKWIKKEYDAWKFDRTFGETANLKQIEAQAYEKEKERQAAKKGEQRARQEVKQHRNFGEQFMSGFYRGSKPKKKRYYENFNDVHLGLWEWGCGGNEEWPKNILP